MRKLIEEHYRKNFQTLVNKLSKRAGSINNAEDIVQDAYEAAMKWGSKYSKELGDFDSWFNGVLNRTFRAFKRDEKLCGMTVEYDEGLDDGVPLDESDGKFGAYVKKELDKLDYSSRQCLYLYFFREYKPREIERVIDMSNSAIRKKIFDFKKRIKDKLYIEYKKSYE